MQEKKRSGREKKSAPIEYEKCRHKLWVMDDNINDIATADAVLESGYFRSDNTVDQTGADDEDYNDENSKASSQGFKEKVVVWIANGGFIAEFGISRIKWTNGVFVIEKS